MRDGFRVFDTHTHVGEGLHSGRRFSADDLIRLMDREGVDRSLVIPFPVVADERAAHDEIAAAVRRWPDRLVGCACLWPFGSHFADELRRCVEELGFRALKLQPQYHGLNPLSPRSESYFETAAKWRIPLVVHTGAGAPFALPSLYIHPARRFPELEIVLGHAGGGLYAGEAIVAATVCPNVYVELSSLMPHHIREVLQHVPSSRLMAGSDLPESVSTEIGKIVELNTDRGVKEDILWNTAIRVFNRS